MKCDKKIIENIPPEGVTAEQLLSHCKYLQTTIPQSFNLTKEQINDAITNTVLKILKKMNEGFVNSTDYQQFKNYLYITLKNALLQEYHKSTRKKIIPTEDIDKFDDDIISTQEVDDKYIYNNLIETYKPFLYEIINKLPGTKKDIATDYLRGDKRIDIAKKYNITKQQIHNIIRKIKRELIKKTLPQPEPKPKPTPKPKVYRKREYKKRISNGRWGHKLSPETKQKISESLKRYYNEK